MSRRTVRAVRAASATALASCLGIFGMPAGAATVGPEANANGTCPGMAELESRGYRIGSIDVRQLPIFDEEPGAKHQALYRLADQLHIDTRDSVIESQLLFQTGDPVSQRNIVETERNLRDLRYIREPSVRAVNCHDGTVDLEVAVHEVWTTNPGIVFRPKWRRELRRHQARGTEPARARQAPDRRAFEGCGPQFLYAALARSQRPRQPLASRHHVARQR